MLDRTARRLAPAVSFLALSAPSLADLPVGWFVQFPGGAARYATDDAGVTYVTSVQSVDSLTSAVAPDGTVSWSESYEGGNGSAFVGATTIAPDGRWVGVGARFQSSQYDMLVLSRDPATGALLDAFPYSAPDDETATAVAVDAQGAYYLGGYVAPEPYAYDARIVKLDAGGQPVWERTWVGSAGDWDRVLDLRLAPDGHVLVLLDTSLSGTKQDYVVWKLRSDTGAEIWQATWGGVVPDVPTAMRVDAAGDVYVTGSKNGIRFATVKWHGSDGSLAWEAIDDVEGSMRPNDLELDGAGHLIVAGRIDLDGTWGDHDDDAYVVKRRTSDGALVWARTVGEGCEGCYESAERVRLLPSGRIALALVSSYDVFSLTALVLEPGTGVEVDRGDWSSSDARVYSTELSIDPAGGLLIGAEDVDVPGGHGLWRFGAPADCPATVYCDESQNPANTADIGITGCDVTGPVYVTLENAPPKQFCYLLIGDLNGVVSTPPGSDGDLCIAGGSCLGRYAKDIGPTNAIGAYATDLAASASGGPNFGIPTCGGAIDAGETWYFQYWHRRPGGQPSGFSSALAVTFQ